jgi:hypothetical protein
VGIEAGFLSMMPDTIIVYAKTSLDQYGKRTFSGTGTPYRCRMQDANELLRTTEGREVVITGRVYLYGAPTDITTDHKIVLPDGSSPVVHMVTVNNDQTGAHHTVIEYGRG